MTIMAAEGTAARAPAAQPKPAPQAKSQAPRGRPGPAGPQGRQGRQGRRSQQRQRYGVSAGRSGQFSPDFANYQGIILAEFVLAELLVAATPIATGKQASGLSPYAPRDMTKLLAIGGVYFLLELVPLIGGKSGKFAAMFGLLILLVLGMNEAANIVKDIDVLLGVENAGAKIKAKLGGSTTTTQAT